MLSMGWYTQINVEKKEDQFMIKRLLVPEILFPIVLLVVLFLVVSIIWRLLKWKANKDANGELNYSKIPDWLIAIVAIVVVVVIVLVVLKPTLTVGSLIGGVICAIYIIYRLEKNNKN